MNKASLKKIGLLAISSVLCLLVASVAEALSGLSSVATNVTGNLTGLAKLITAGSYVAGLGFGVGSVVKFKAHKDNAAQTPIGQPIALLFVAAALIFIPSVYQTTGGTLFGNSGVVGGISGVTGFGAKKATGNT
ncbi:MAG: type IV secretion protein IcmD [Gammaproteobacteria bacterium]|nr:type IV secretion protein IcmD [Gammaproteobacteria bacterium]